MALRPRLPIRIDRRSARWIALLIVGAVVLVQRCGRDGPAAPESAELPTQCSVSRLADGDSLECAGGAEVRLVGIDAPELSQPRFGRQSQDALGAIIRGKTLRLEYDVDRRDRFGRLLVYAWSGPDFVNERMVREGWAVAFRVPPNKRHISRLRAAERAARSEGAGHWATGGFECLPVDHRAGEC